MHPVNREDKSRLLAWHLVHHGWRQVLVFTRTKHGADRLCARSTPTASARSPCMATRARTRALVRWPISRAAPSKCSSPPISQHAASTSTNSRTWSTTIFPMSPATTSIASAVPARAGADGEAISLVCVDEHVFLRDIERLIKRTIPRHVIPGFEPDPNAVAQTVFAQRGRGAPQSRAHAQQGQKRPQAWGQPDSRGQGRSQPQQARHARGTTQGNGNAAGNSHARGHAPADRGGADHAQRPARSQSFGQRPSSRRTDARNAATPAHSRAKTKH